MEDGLATYRVEITDELESSSPERALSVVLYRLEKEETEAVVTEIATGEEVHLECQSMERLRTTNNRSQIDAHLRAILCRQRGQNQPLAKELTENLSPEHKERLFRVLQGMQQELDAERSKRRRMVFW